MKKAAEGWHPRRHVTPKPSRTGDGSSIPRGRPSIKEFFMSTNEERDFILRCLESLKDADLVHHLAVVACTLRDLQRDRKEAV